MSNPTLRVHPKFLCLAAKLNISQALTRGLLECLWDAASDSGEPDIGNAHAIETAACWTGEPGQLCTALLQCGCGRAGFIEEIPGKPGLYRLHDLVANSPAELVRKWVRRQDRIAKGATVAEIREISAQARATKNQSKNMSQNPEPPPQYSAASCSRIGSHANDQAGPTLPLSDASPAAPRNGNAGNNRELPIAATVPASRSSTARQTASNLPASNHRSNLSHYIPSFDEVQHLIATAGFNGDAHEFISEYQSMPLTEPDRPDRWQKYLLTWATQKVAHWERDAEERCQALIASASR